MSASLIFDYTSTTDPATIAPPSGLSLLINGDVVNTVVLTWGGPSRAHHTTFIERSTDGTTWAALANVKANVHSYTDATATGVTVGTAYYYRVRAYREEVYDGKSVRQPVFSEYSP